MEEVTREGRQELAQLEAARRELQSEWVARQKKRIAELEQGFRAAEKRLEGEVARLTADIQDRSLRAQLEKQSGRRMAKLGSDARAEVDAAVVDALASSQQDLGVGAEVAATGVPPEQLVAGMRVHVRGFKQAVVFRRHDGRIAEVEAGPLRMKVPIADILGIEAEASAAKQNSAAPQRPRGITVRTQPSDEPPGEEINVIGCTVEEATRRVDKFIDEAAIAGRPSVRIVHGHGTGALRRGLAEFLSAHPLVSKVRHEAEDRGGTAITVAEVNS
jgi:DNA mismatch repair protein MutS2